MKKKLRIFSKKIIEKEAKKDLLKVTIMYNGPLFFSRNTERYFDLHNNKYVYFAKDEEENYYIKFTNEYSEDAFEVKVDGRINCRLSSKNPLFEVFGNKKENQHLRIFPNKVSEEDNTFILIKRL